MRQADASLLPQERLAQQYILGRITPISNRSSIGRQRAIQKSEQRYKAIFAQKLFQFLCVI